MPEPGISNPFFNRPTADKDKRRFSLPNGKRLRKPVKLSREYADFQLENGRQAVEVLGESFFEPDTNSTLFEGNDPLGHASRKHPEKYAPRPVAEAGILYRDGATLPPVLSPRFYRDPVAPTSESEYREMLGKPAKELPTRSRPNRASDLPLPQPVKPENEIPRTLPSRNRMPPDKWAEMGWGGPRGYYSVPILNNGSDRIANILADRPAKFDIQANLEADPGDPWYASTLAGNATIASYGPAIETESKRQGVDPDLAKAIAYSENARGHYFGSAKAAEGLGMADSFLPMNINPAIWGGLGIDRESANDYLTNIRAGITLIKRISERVEDPTAEKVASIWNFTGRERVNDFGAYVGRMYVEKPWAD